MSDWLFGLGGALGFAWSLGIVMFVSLCTLRNPPTSGDPVLDRLIANTLEMRERADTQSACIRPCPDAKEEQGTRQRPLPVTVERVGACDDRRSNADVSERSLQRA
jgi:hypothetical protein